MPGESENQFTFVVQSSQPCEVKESEEQVDSMYPKKLLVDRHYNKWPKINKIYNPFIILAFDKDFVN